MGHLLGRCDPVKKVRSAGKSGSGGRGPPAPPDRVSPPAILDGRARKFQRSLQHDPRLVNLICIHWTEPGGGNSLMSLQQRVEKAQREAEGPSETVEAERALVPTPPPPPVRTPGREDMLRGITIRLQGEVVNAFDAKLD